MRITTIDTADQRDAVNAAAAAARIVVRCIPGAKLLELASEVAEGVDEKYLPLAAWSDTTELGGTRLWSTLDDDTRDMLGGADYTEVTNWLRTAGQADPNVFGPGDLAVGVWELHLDAVLKLDADEDADAIVDYLEASDMPDDAIRQVLVDVAAEHHGAHDDIAGLIDEAMAGGSETQARFLVNLLGGFAAHAELVAAA